MNEPHGATRPPESTTPAAEAEGVIQELSERFGRHRFFPSATRDGIPTAWVRAELLHDVLRYLESSPRGAYAMLCDLTAIDERARTHREGQPPPISPWSTTCSP